MSADIGVLKCNQPSEFVAGIFTRIKEQFALGHDTIMLFQVVDGKDELVGVLLGPQPVKETLAHAFLRLNSKLPCSSVYEAILQLRARKAVHRSGFRLDKINKAQQASYLLEEVAEVLDAVLWEHPQPRVEEELADAYACLLHCAIQHGTSFEQLERAALAKMQLRFLPPEVPMPNP